MLLIKKQGLDESASFTIKTLNKEKPHLRDKKLHYNFLYPGLMNDLSRILPEMYNIPLLGEEITFFKERKVTLYIAITHLLKKSHIYLLRL